MSNIFYKISKFFSNNFR